VEAPCQRYGGTAATQPSLSAPDQWLPYLPAVSQTLRQDLRAAHRGLLHPYPGDRTMADDRLHQLDKLYQSVAAALDQLMSVMSGVGLKLAA
jgi:hypothetical protein